MSDDKKKSEPKPFGSEMKTAPATGVPNEGVEIALGETATLTSGSESFGERGETVEISSADLADFDAANVSPPPQLAGKYTIQDGDTPFSVALEMYGQGSRGAELRRANRNVPWKTGAVISL